MKTAFCIWQSAIIALDIDAFIRKIRGLGAQGNILKRSGAGLPR